MIFDCFTFFNELELLELRLHELAGVVDKFVVVEARRTHSNQPKPLHFQENRARFAQFEDKIIHVVVEEVPDTTDAWVIERFQRDAIARGLGGCRPDDWVLVSDVDEIPRAAVVAKISRETPYHDNLFSNAVHAALNSKMVKAVFHRKGFRRRLRKNHPFVLKFEQTLHRHYLNCVSVRPRFWYGTRMLRFRDFSAANELRFSGYKIVKDAGWHFTFMGGADRIREKIVAYAHQEFNQRQFTEPAAVTKRIESGKSLFDRDEQLEFVPLDETFPRFVLAHPQKFSSWLKPF
ncbi:MAG: hypothetical protein P4N60_04765 [Verrucomicrobiae bacterium]|nr:hypothetical protein [Verrucomicrobiae bacterium]